VAIQIPFPYFAGLRKTHFFKAKPTGFWGFIGFWALLGFLDFFISKVLSGKLVG